MTLYFRNANGKSIWVGITHTHTHTHTQARCHIILSSCNQISGSQHFDNSHNTSLMFVLYLCFHIPLNLLCLFPSSRPTNYCFCISTLINKIESTNHFSSVAQSCPTLCYPMNRSTPGLPVHHQLPEFTQTHVHWVGDAIQPTHPLSPLSPPAPNPSQHQGLFQWVNSSHEVAKVLEFQL